METKTSEYN